MVYLNQYNNAIILQEFPLYIFPYLQEFPFYIFPYLHEFPFYIFPY